jgi:predicted amidohydrolase
MKYTLLLKNGRIIDPANGVDAFADLGIRDGKIVDSGNPLEASEALQVVDLKGRWIIPGVIDPHMHVSSWIGGAPGLRMMAKEGVVTALDMAGPVSDVIDNVKNHGSGMNILCLDAFTRGEEQTPKVDYSDA